MALRENKRVDLVEDDRLAACRMLHIDRIAGGAEQAGIGDDLDAELVEPSDRLVAHIPGDDLAGHQPVDAESHAAAVAGELLGKTQSDPVGTPIGNDDRASDIGIALEHLPCIDAMSFIAAFEIWPI